MLQLINGLDNPVLNTDDFYVTEKWSGLDELVFTISIHDPAYPSILEEALIRYEQPYLIKAIDGGTETAKVKCQLDVDVLKGEMLLDYTNGSATVHDTVAGVVPAGWVVLDHSGLDQRRTIAGEAYTPLEVVQACPDTYGVAIRFDVAGKIVHIYNPDRFEPMGAFASRELNLREINYKGKSSGFATRLYAYGKDGMSFASINGGKPYVEDHSYSDKVICAYWKDERYTIAENLLADAKRNLKEMAVPARSYSCSVYDLAATNPEMYGFLDFSLFSVVKLVDDIKGTSLAHQVVEYRCYPEYPEKNEVTLSTVAPTVTGTVKNIQQQIERPTSPFRQQMQQLIDNMAAAIAGYDGGNMVITQNGAGKPSGIMIMDTDDRTTAKKVLWLNLSGITYSQNGVDGPFDTVWSFAQNGFGANWIVVETMLADRIRGGKLTLGGKDNGNGVAEVLDAAGNQAVLLNKDGIKSVAGEIGGWTIGRYKIYGGTEETGVAVVQLPSPYGNWVFAAGGKSHDGYADCPFRVHKNGKMYATNAEIAGKITASSGTIGEWIISGQAFYKDVTAPDGTIYRVYFQPPLQSSPDSTWILSCQKSTNGGSSFKGIFILYSDGSARFGDGAVLINADGSVDLGRGRFHANADGSMVWRNLEGAVVAGMDLRSDGRYELWLGHGTVSASNVPDSATRYSGTIYTKNQSNNPISIDVVDGLVARVNS